MGHDADLVNPRYQRGARCFAAWSGDRIVSYGWVSQGAEWIGELEHAIVPEAQEAYVWNCVTLVEHRRRRLFTALLCEVTRALAVEGVNRLWIGTVAGYEAGEAGVRGAGFTPALSVSYLRFGGWRSLRVRPAAAGVAMPAFVG